MTRDDGPRVLDVRGHDADSEPMGEAADHVRSGGLLAYPTETVYGFGGPCTPEGVAALTALKGRSPDKPFIVLVADPAAAADLTWTAAASELAEVFWPGALTLVLRDPGASFPAGVRGPDGKVAVRCSPHPIVRALVEGTGGPLTSTSANAPGSPPAISGHEALAAARALGAGPELLVLDAGTLPPSPSSTVIDCTGPDPVVLRAGSVPVQRIRCVLPLIRET